MYIPEPPGGGSTGKQQPVASDTTPIEMYSPLAGLSMAQRFEGLAAARPHNFGGAIAATLLAGSYSQMSTELQIQRENASTAIECVNDLQQELGKANTRVAVLEERLAAHDRTQNVKHIAIFAGTALLAVAIDLYKAEMFTLGTIVALLGGALLVFGWISRQRGIQK